MCLQRPANASKSLKTPGRKRAGLKNRKTSVKIAKDNIQLNATRQIKIVSIFSGAGGEIQACKNIGKGLKVITAVEVKSHLRGLLRCKLGPGAKIYEDVTHLKGDDPHLKGTSLLGPRDFLDHKETGHFRTIIRLLKEYKEKHGTLPKLILEQPESIRFDFTENAAIDLKYSPLEVVYQELRALGYNIAHTQLNGLQLGELQARERVFIVATRDLSCLYIAGLERHDACTKGCLKDGKNPCSLHAHGVGPIQAKLSVINTQHGVSEPRWGKSYCGTITPSSEWWIISPSVSPQRSPPVMSFSIESLEILQGFEAVYSDCGGLKLTQRFEAIGNAIMPRMIAPLLRRLVIASKGKPGSKVTVTDLAKFKDWVPRRPGFVVNEQKQQQQGDTKRQKAATSPKNGFLVSSVSNNESTAMMKGYDALLGHWDSRPPPQPKALLEHLMDGLPETISKEEKIQRLLAVVPGHKISKYCRRLLSRGISLPPTIASILRRSFHVAQDVLQPNIELVELCIAKIKLPQYDDSKVDAVIEVIRPGTVAYDKASASIRQAHGNNKRKREPIVGRLLSNQITREYILFDDDSDLMPCTEETFLEFSNPCGAVKGVLGDNIKVDQKVMAVSKELQMHMTGFGDHLRDENTYWCKSKASSRLKEARESNDGLFCGVCAVCKAESNVKAKTKGIRPTICLQLKADLLGGEEQGALVGRKRGDALGMLIEMTVSEKAWRKARRLVGMVVDFDETTTEHTVLFDQGSQCFVYKGRLALSFSVLNHGRLDLTPSKKHYYQSLSSSMLKERRNVVVLDAERDDAESLTATQLSMVVKLVASTALGVSYGSGVGGPVIKSKIKTYRLRQATALFSKDGGLSYTFGTWFMTNLRVLRSYIDSVRKEDGMDESKTLLFLKSIKKAFDDTRSAALRSGNVSCAVRCTRHDVITPMTFLRSSLKRLGELEAKFVKENLDKNGNKRKLRKRMAQNK